MNASTASCISFVCVRFGIVCAYSLISLSVNTPTSPYTHLARFGINAVSCASSVLASVSYGLSFLSLPNIGQVLIFDICSSIPHICSSTRSAFLSSSSCPCVGSPQPSEYAIISCILDSTLLYTSFLSSRNCWYLACCSGQSKSFCGLKVLLLYVDISLVLISVLVVSSSTAFGCIVVGINHPHVHAIVASDTNSFLSISSPLEFELITIYHLSPSLNIGQLASTPICQ